MTRRVCVVVDGYSVGAHLAPEFGRLGFDCVHVQSRPDLPPLLRRGPRAADYVDLLVHRGDLAETVRGLARHDVVCAIPGNELGVRLADQLSETMGLPGNGTRRSSARRNKMEMVEALRAAGVPSVPTCSSSDVTEILEWARRRGDWPIVVKPPDSAGSEDVAFCTSLTDVAAAFRRIHMKVNRVGQVNTTVLAQAFLRGTQYIVNTVSCGGVHRICEIWRDQRAYVEDGAQIYDREELLDADGPVQDALSRYVERVLDALEIRWGPTHAEVMMTADGPILIEIGARMQGAIIPGALAACLGEDPVSLTCLCYTRPDAFLSAESRRYRRRRRALVVDLVSRRAGVVTGTQGLDRVRALPTFFGMIGDRKVGDRVDRTVDFVSSPGFVYLVGDTDEDLERDYRHIREWEVEGLYQLAPH